MNWKLGAALFGLALVTANPSRAAEPKECTGTKVWYAGQCRYPPEISRMKHKSARRSGDSPAEMKRAARIFKKACEQADSEPHCAMYGRFLAYGWGVKKDVSRALRYLEPACRAGEMEACSTLGVIHANGMKVEQDHRKARQLYTRACQGGVPNACFNLGWTNHHGQGTEVNHASAAANFRRACDGGHAKGCTLPLAAVEPPGPPPTTMI